MREIKFRCWDNEANVMLSDISDGMMIQMNSGKVGWYDDHGDFEEKNYPLMQFTGLKDKNGKEAYDGDILGFMDYIIIPTECGTDHNPVYNKGEMKFDIDSCRYYITNTKSVDWEDIVSDGMVFAEVIGNIHENPELL